MSAGHTKVTTAPVVGRDDDRFERGLALLGLIGGTSRAEAELDSLAGTAPHLARYVVEFVYGDICARPGLTPRQRELVAVASLTALGTAPAQLSWHIGGALNVGVSAAEIVEALMHVAAYAGFPAALNGITAAREVFESRPDLDYVPTAEPTADGDRFTRGLDALRKVDGQTWEPVIASLSTIAPDLGRYLVEFGFGDLYSRGGLDPKSRELAAIAACTALGTAAPQLRLHIQGFLNVGGTETEVIEIIIQMAVFAGFPAALNAVSAAREVLGRSTSST